MLDTLVIMIIKRETTFAKRLKQLRHERKLSQRDLAEELQMHHGVIAKWELGKSMPNIEAVILFADYFEVTVGYMAGKEE